jgi:hypothetical protein
VNKLNKAKWQAAFSGKSSVNNFSIVLKCLTKPGISGLLSGTSLARGVLVQEQAQWQDSVWFGTPLSKAVQSECVIVCQPGGNPE